jgi:hypothetical protein
MMTQEEEKRPVRRRLSFSFAAPRLSNQLLVPSGGPDVARQIASFLPYPEQFGSLRTLSRDLNRALPNEPSKPQAAFTVRLDTCAGSALSAIALGTYTLPHLRRFLQQV